MSWLAGITALGVVAWYVSPRTFLETVGSVGAAGTLAWLALLLSARLLMIDITTRPIRALGLSLGRAEAFWIGWVRTFSNQVFPFTGFAYYAHRLRQSSGISWAQLAALSWAQLLLAAAGISLAGVVATLVNFSVFGGAALPTLAVFTAVALASLLIALRPGALAERVPGAIRLRLGSFVGPATRLAGHPGLVPVLTLIQCLVVLLHGARLWVLFAAVGVPLAWHEALLLLVIAEGAALIQITPGGLGLREGAILGAALLLNVSPEAAASVALFDRFCMMAVTTLLAAPALVRIHRSKPA